VDNADLVVIVGANLRHELPLVNARVRKASLKGAKVHVVNPVDFDQTFELAGRHIVAPSKIADALGGADLRNTVGDAKAAVVIVGALAENGIHASAIRAAAHDFAQATGAALCRIPQGANAVGLGDHGVLPRSRDAQAMLAQPRSAYVLYGIEPGLDFADTATAMKALNGAQVVAFSQYACESTRAVADVILPIGLLPEVDATLTNLDGREQVATPAGKLPGQARPGWRVLRALGGMLEAPGFEFTDLAGLRAGIAKREVAVAAGNAPAGTTDGLELAVSAAIYRGDAVLRRAAALQSHPLNKAPYAMLNPADAQTLGLADGDTGKFGAAAGTAMLPVTVSEQVAPGTVWVESGHGATAPLGAGRVQAGRA
ncbi:MAG TPA: molybdopterin-dependent oxidoreductase, partial [Rhodanobacteraceae bacterium]|nr:molybdopterin-dependent oxidoreductase [Rhodanobacteraceae bacterium]